MPRPDPGDRRQRKKHQKSRRGCQTCKAKHVRCDEKRPHCSYCFKRGIPCEFSEETSPRPTHAQSLVHIPGQYDGLPKHSFVGYPIEMTEGSYALVHLVAHYSTPKDLSPSPSLERALRTPPLLHGLLLLASYLWSWHNDNIGHIRQAFLQHRLEAMQYLNQQAQLAASDDTTISLISHLALAETVIGSEAAGEIHLKGLAELVSLRGHRPVRHHYLLIRDMAALHDQCVGDFKVRDMIELIGPFHQDEFRLFALTRVILAPIIEAMKDDPSLGELPIRIAAQVARARDPNPVCNLPVGLVRRAAYLWCYTQLFVILGRDHMDPQLPYGWHITVNVRMDLERTTPALRAANPFIRATWLFVALRGLSFVYAARETSEWDKKQKLAWKQDYRTLLRLANAELGISDFEGVKAALRGWFWRDDFPSEDSLRAIWEDVVLGKGDAFSSPLSSPSVRSGELALPHRTKAAASSSSPAPTVTVPAAKGDADSAVQLLALPFSGNGFYFSEAYPKWPQTREPIPRI